jgi:hypothetical protein
VFGHKVVTNGEEIVSEFLGVAWWDRVTNHVEFNIAFSEGAFKKIDSESREAVFVSDHNF